MRPLRIALQFLTRLPIRLERPAEPGEAGQALLWFPVVGLLLGLFLWLLYGLLDDTDPLLRAALLLAAWVVATGALHLDGLADTADAWVGGQGDRERTLAILKDPYIGPMGAAALLVVLLVKFAALTALAEGAYLWLAPFLARGLVLGLFASTPYVRPGGLGEAMAAELPARQAKFVLAGCALVAVLFFGDIGLLAAMAAGLWLLLFRARLLARLGGTTGDTAGALVEVGEAIVLVTLAI